MGNVVLVLGSAAAVISLAAPWFRSWFFDVPGIATPAGVLGLAATIAALALHRRKVRMRSRRLVQALLFTLCGATLVLNIVWGALPLLWGIWVYLAGIVLGLDGVLIIYMLEKRDGRAP